MVNPSLTDCTPGVHVVIFNIAVICTLPFSSFVELISGYPSSFNYIIQESGNFILIIGPCYCPKSPYFVNLLLSFIVQIWYSPVVIYCFIIGFLIVINFHVIVFLSPSIWIYFGLIWIITIMGNNLFCMFF